MVADVHDARLLDALKWLSIVRQASVGHETVTAYALDLRALPVHAVEQACHEIGRAPRDREARETAWPELGAIRARALAIVRLERERDEARRALQPPVDTPIEREKLASFRQHVAARIRRLRMPD